MREEGKQRDQRKVGWGERQCSLSAWRKVSVASHILLSVSLPSTLPSSHLFSQFFLFSFFFHILINQTLPKAKAMSSLWAVRDTERENRQKPRPWSLFPQQSTAHHWYLSDSRGVLFQTKASGMVLENNLLWFTILIVYGANWSSFKYLSCQCMQNPTE